ncbi:MAG: tRNA 2-thiouridine(34) synthase MnmA [Clostridia bacterium]|nr:tRNA 2-thiouridine(34) synthase MnmA [Clostridia bacterium]
MRILVGLSGGLDSTWAVRALLDEGHSVEGCALRFSEHTDIEGAERVAGELDIPLHIVDAAEAFNEFVVGNFISEYAAGRTPNPCIMCNRYAKIAVLVDFAREHGFDRAATGHYCGAVSEKGRCFIRCAADMSKDQSYVLWQLTQDQLAMLMMPLASLSKADIRASARALGYSSAESKESQEICFIPDHDYAAFIEARLGRFPEGDFVDETGKVVGRHNGIIHYTVGQRKGLGIALGRPYFITRIEPETNHIHIAPAGGEMSRTIRVRGLNFQKLAPEDACGNAVRCDVKVRYGAKAQSAEVSFSSDRRSAEITFDEPVRAATPGQSAVGYIGGDLAFGGFIE